jgi:ADP-ribose pyrophosphatase YjhB (NUDIX family)
MIERVRAVLVTPRDELLFIRREKPDTPVYWVAAGGHVEPTDASREDALHREVHEELAGTPDIEKLIQIIDGDTDRQYIYLARIAAWSFPDRSGPEFSDTGRGVYALDAVPMTTAALGRIALKPDALATFLSAALVESASLFALPDLRLTS